MSEPNTNSHQDNKTPSSSSSSCLRFTRPTLRPTNGAVTTTTSDNTATACQASHLSLTTSSSSSLVTPSTSDGSPSRRYSEVTLARHASSTATGSAASSSPQPLPMPHTTTTTTTTTSNINRKTATASSSRAAELTTASPPPLSASVLSVEEYPPRECPTSHDNNNTTKGTTEHTLVPSCSETAAEEESDKSATRHHTVGTQLSCSTSLVPTPMSAHKTTHNITSSTSNSHALFLQGQTSMCEEAGTHVCTGTDTDLASTGLYALSAHTSVETSSLPMTCHDERDGAASAMRVETSSTTAVTTTAITQPITITIVPTTTTTTTIASTHNNNSSTTSSGDAGGPVVHTAMMSTSNELTGHTAWMTSADDKPHTSLHSPSDHHNNDNKEEGEEDVESAGCSPRSFLSRTVPAGGSSGDAMVPGHHASSSSSSSGERQAVHGEAQHDETNTPIPTPCVTSSSAAVNDDNDVTTRHAAQESHNARAVSRDKHEMNKACSDATDLQPSAARAEMTASDSPAPLQQPQQQAESATCVANGISSDRHASSAVTATKSAVSRLRRRAPALTIVTTLPSDYTNNNTPHDTPITIMSIGSSSNAAMVVRASATLLPGTGNSTTVVAGGEEAVAQSQPWHGASCDAQQQDKEEEGRRAMMMGEREGGESSTLTPNASQHHHNNTSTSSHGTAHAMDAVPSSGHNTTTTQSLSSASHTQPHYVTHHPSVSTIIIPAHHITSSTSTSNMGSAALPPLLLQTHTTTTTSNAQHAQTQRAALYAEREPSLSACGTPFTSSPAVLSCRSSTPRTTTSVASSATNTTSMYSARSARYSHYRRGATLTTQGGTAATMLHGHHYCYYPTLTLREWFPQLPVSLRLSRERVYVHRSRERQLGKGAYGVVMLGQLYPPRTSVQVEREARWSGYDMSRCSGGSDGAARTNANATTVVITATVEGNNDDTGGGEAEKTKSAAGGGSEGSGEVRSGTNDVTASSHNTTTTTTTKTAVAVGDVMPMHQQPYSKYTVAFYDCGPQPFLTNFASRKTTTIMSITAKASRRNHATAVHDVTSPSSSPQQQQQHEEAQALIASPPPPPSSASLLRKSEGTVQGSSSSNSNSRMSGRQAQLHRALTLSLPHNTHDEEQEDNSEKKEEDVTGPTQPVTPTMTTPSVTQDNMAALESNNKQFVTVTEAAMHQTLPQQRTSPALPPCEEMTATHMETTTTTTSTSDGVPHTTVVVTTAPPSSKSDDNAVVVVGHETGRTQQYSSPAIPRMPLGVTTQRPLASPQLSSALSLDTTVPSMTPTTNNSSSSSSPLLWLPTTTSTTTSTTTTTTTSTTNTRKSSAAAVLRASQLVRQSSPPLTFPALRHSPSLHGLTETTATTTSPGLMSTRPQTTTTLASVAAVTMMPTRGSGATTTTTHIPLVTSSTITTTTSNSNSNAALVAASALRTQLSPAQPPSPLLPLRRALSVHYSPHTRRYATQGTSNNNNNDANDNDNDTSRHAYAQPRTGSPALSSSPSQLHLFTTLSPEQQTRHQSRRPPPASVEEHVLRATSTTTPGPPLCSSSSLLVKSSSAAVYRRTYDSQEDHRATSLTTAPRLHDTTLTQSFSSSSLQQQHQHERLQGTTTTTAGSSVGRLTPQLSPAKTPSPPSPPLSRLLRQQQQQQRGQTRSNSRYATPSMLRDASAARASPPPLSAATAPTPDKATPTTTVAFEDEPHRLLHPSNNNNSNTLVMTSSMAEASPQTQQERHTMAEEEEMTVKAPSTTTHDDIIIPTTTTTNMLSGDVLIQGDLLSTRREATLYDTHSTTTTTTTHAASVWRRSTPLTAPSAFNNNNKSYLSSFTQATNTALIPDSGAVTQSSRHVTSSSATRQLPYRAVAVKVIYKADLAKPVFAEAAHNEVVMASQLHHPCLVNFFGIAEDKDYLLFVMDLSEKGDLRQYLERYGPRHTRRMAPRFLADVVLALEYFRDAQQHPYEPSHNVEDTSSTTAVRKTNYQQHYRTSTMPTTTTTSTTAPVTARASWESNVATSLRGTPVSCDEAQQQHSAHTTNASTFATTTPVSGDGSHLLQSGDPVAAEGSCADSSVEVTPHTLSPTVAAGQHSHANESQHHTILLHPISTTTTITAQMDTVPEQTLTTTTASHPPNQPMQQQHNYTSTSSFASSLQDMAQTERQSVLPPHPCSTITSSSNAEGPGEETESTVRHCRGIVLHRDLKPDNLTLTWDYHVKIGDFGSACFYEDDEGNRFAGSPAYISPEVILHDKAGPYSDLWAMGCILYELLEGRAAFAADTPFLLTQKIKHFEPDSLVFSSSTLSDHNNNNSNDEDEGFSEYEEDEEQRMGHARDLVRQLLQPVPEARLGSRERGGFATLKAHPFFATIDWSHVLTTSNLTMSNTNYAHEIAEYLRANETLRYCSPVVRLEQQQCNASPSLQEQEQQQQHETDSNGCTSGSNEASDEGTKKKGSSTQGVGPMLLVLTSAPRLFLIDPLTSTVALTVPWSTAITVRGLSADCFALHLPATQDKSTTPVNVQHNTSAQEAMPCDGHEIVFRDLTRCAQRWVRHIEAWLQQKDYHNTMNGNETSSSSVLLGTRMSSSPKGEGGSSQPKAAAQQTYTSTQRQQRRQSMSTTSHHSLLHHLRTAALAQLTQPAETTTGNYHGSTNTQGVCYCSGSGSNEGRNGVMSYAFSRHHHRAQREATTTPSSSSPALHGGQSMQDRNAATMSEGVLASALRHGPRTPLYPLNATQS